MGWLIAAGLLCLAACGLVYGFFRAKRRSDLMASTDTATVEFLQSLAHQMGSSPLAYLTEVKGLAICDRPMVSELSQTECVYYSMTVKREYEEVGYETDEKGNRRRTTHRKSDIVSSNRRSLPFVVQDATGEIQVRPEGAQLIAEKVVDRFEPAESTRQGFKLGSFSLDLNVGGLNFGNGSRTLGYRFEEEVIPTQREIYVLGEATGSADSLRLQKPAKGQMILSVKSEEQLQREAGKSSKAYVFAYCL